MLKPTKRKAFNFLRSYFDVLNELQNDKDRLAFLLSIISKQFLDEDPEKLNFIVNLCYESQRHQIESSVNGWKRVNKDTPLTNPPTLPPTLPPTNPIQEEEEEEEKEKEKEEVQVKHYRKFKHLKMSVDEYNKLLKKGYTKLQIDNILDSIENYSKNKNYTSLYLTAGKWLVKEHGENNKGADKVTDTLYDHVMKQVNADKARKDGIS